MRLAVIGFAGAAAIAAPAAAQDRFLINDRTLDAIVLVDDANANGVIDEPGEVHTWFSAANAAGTIGPSNPTCLAVRGDGLAAMGDQGLGVVFLLRDGNRDGDALDAGESVVAAGPGNASGVSLAFPTGAAFDAGGTLHVVNAGNSFGSDALYRMTDRNADGDFQDADEIEEFVAAGAFGPGNGPYSPQEAVFLPVAAYTGGLLRNSSASLHGVFAFRDLNHNGRADDPGEFAAYFDATNGSGIAPSAGFPLEFDAAAPGAVYLHQTVTGGVDQVIRLTDANHDDDAQDPGEALLVFETSEAGFTGVDLVSAAATGLLVTDNSGKKVIVLTDLDMDGKFMSPGERRDFFANAMGLVGDVRQMAQLPRVCYPDCDGSGTLNVNDYICFQTGFALGNPYADCNGDGQRNVNDYICFQTSFALGC